MRDLRGLVLAVAVLVAVMPEAGETAPLTGRSQRQRASSAEHISEQLSPRCPAQGVGAVLGVDPLLTRAGAGLPGVLSTHPSDETRIRQFEGWLPEAERDHQAR